MYQLNMTKHIPKHTHTAMFGIYYFQDIWLYRNSVDIVLQWLNRNDIYTIVGMAIYKDYF